MLLVVDFYDLNLEFDKTDIRIDSSADYTAGKLLDQLCSGIEEIGKAKIINRSRVILSGPDQRPIDKTKRVRDLSLCDWDTIYLTYG